MLRTIIYGLLALSVIIAVIFMNEFRIEIKRVDAVEVENAGK